MIQRLIITRTLTLIIICLHDKFALPQETASNNGISSQSLMSLISPRDIAELTQVATQFAAQTFRSNGEIISNSGPEVRALNLNSRPSELIGQGLTNIFSPARQNLANTLRQGRVDGIRTSSVNTLNGEVPPNTGSTLIEQLAGNFFGSRPLKETESPAVPEARMDNVIDQAMRFISGRRLQNPSISNSDNALHSKQSANMFPTLNQLLPGSEKNFGFKQGEGCVPFIGEFMTMAYGNCVRKADEKTWDTWGKEINNALMGGKIDLLRASKETCKMGAEREHCGQLRKAISECNILGSIQMATNLQRSVSRCDEVTGLVDQNPSTVFRQMNGLINGEMAQGFLNNFLG